MQELILSIIDFLISMVNFFPTLPTENMENISSSVTYILDLLGRANFLIPVPDLLLIITIIVGFRVTLLTIFVINWVIRRIMDIIP